MYLTEDIFQKRFLVGLTDYRGYQSIQSFTVVID